MKEDGPHWSLLYQSTAVYQYAVLYQYVIYQLGGQDNCSVPCQSTIYQFAVRCCTSMPFIYLLGWITVLCGVSMPFISILGCISKSSVSCWAVCQCYGLYQYSIYRFSRLSVSCQYDISVFWAVYQGFVLCQYAMCQFAVFGLCGVVSFLYSISSLRFSTDLLHLNSGGIQSCQHIRLFP